MAYQTVGQIIDSSVICVTGNGEVGYDVGSMSLMCKKKVNSEKIANYLLRVGLFEQYNGVLKNDKTLSIEREFERVKEFKKTMGYVAIAEFLKGADYEFAKNVILKNGSDFEKMKFALCVPKANKVEIAKSMCDSSDLVTLGYMIKYLSGTEFSDLFYSADGDKMIKKISSSNNAFAKAELEKKMKLVRREVRFPKSYTQGTVCCR